MSIASRQWDMIGAHIYAPEGPYGLIGTPNLSGPTFNFGDVVDGNSESEFVFLKFSPVSVVTFNQGDVFVWDASMIAVPSKLTAAYHAFGSHVGAIFFGGRVGDPATAKGQGSSWSYTFQPGTYGIWVQRAGAAVINYGVITSQVSASFTTATVGSISALATGAANSQGIQGVFPSLTSFTFTATDTSGSSQLTAVSDTNKLEIGMTLSGTGIPNGAYITDIQGATVYMNALATSTNAGTTVTAKLGTFWGTTVNGSPLITSPNIPGVFPNATLTGTGVAGTVVSIGGTPGNYTITLSANCTAAGTVSIASTIYVQGFLSWPFISSQT
jgi:hypothetical protein